MFASKPINTYLDGDMLGAVDEELWAMLRTIHERSMLLREATELARQLDELTEAEMLKKHMREGEHAGRVSHALLQDGSGRSSAIPEHREE